MSENTSYIRLENITKWYPYKGGFNMFKSAAEKKWIKAVDGVNLTLEKGEILGVIGESGCGKSTLGRMLMRLENPTKGDVFIDNVSTSEMIKKDQKDFRRMVQIIFQNPFDTFNPRSRIEDILIRPLDIHNIGASREERLQICYDTLEAGGLRPAKDIMARFPHELSGGQLQRISIIRAMNLDPSFIIADEPVSMLDVSVRSDIINMILRLRSEKQATVVFISHDIALTRYISDNIAVMYLGRVVEYGSADEIVKNPRHPYTMALISNCGSIDLEDIEEPITITGEPPTPINPGPGCYFAPRCNMAGAECFEKYPEMKNYGGSHTASCFRIQQ